MSKTENQKGKNLTTLSKFLTKTIYINSPVHTVKTEVVTKKSRDQGATTAHSLSKTMSSLDPKMTNSRLKLLDKPQDNLFQSNSGKPFVLKRILRFTSTKNTDAQSPLVYPIRKREIIGERTRTDKLQSLV